MAYLGKEYKFVKQENFEGFLKSAGLPADQIEKFLEYKPSYKVEQNGDTYTIYTYSNNPEATRKTTFKSGVEFDDKIQDKIPIKTTYTVEGNVITQKVLADLGSATFKREYNGDELVVTITGSKFDGVAKRWYKA